MIAVGEHCQLRAPIEVLVPYTLTEPTADIAGDIARSAQSVGRGWGG
jgi:hypothetical protein